jgi:hypothetical protein
MSLSPGILMPRYIEKNVDDRGEASREVLPTVIACLSGKDNSIEFRFCVARMKKGE